VHHLHRYQRHRWQIFPPFSLALLIPVANLPPVSTTLVALTTGEVMLQICKIIIFCFHTPLFGTRQQRYSTCRYSYDSYDHDTPYRDRHMGFSPFIVSKKHRRLFRKAKPIDWYRSLWRDNTFNPCVPCIENPGKGFTVNEPGYSSIPIHKSLSIPRALQIKYTFASIHSTYYCESIMYLFMFPVRTALVLVVLYCTIYAHHNMST
jgi:hypothetical protein